MIDDLEPVASCRNTTDPSLQITESSIAKLVHSFYAKVRQDPMIGPIFEENIGDDWDNHLSQLCDFWSGIALSSKRYKGQPMLQHVNLAELDKEHFARWLLIFEENAREIYPQDAAEFFIDKARKIADSFMLGINFYRKNF